MKKDPLYIIINHLGQDGKIFETIRSYNNHKNIFISDLFIGEHKIGIVRRLDKIQYMGNFIHYLGLSAVWSILVQNN